MVALLTLTPHVDCLIWAEGIRHHSIENREVGDHFAMNRGQQPQDDFGEIDEIGEYDDNSAPTEPMMPVILSPLSSTIPMTPGASTKTNGMIPTPQPQERPFPQQDHLPFHLRPEAPVYPYLPPAPPLSGKSRPPGGAVPVRPGNAVGPAHSDRASRVQPQRSSFPLLVGFFLVIVQLLLLVRFVLKFVGVPADTLWVSTIYTISGVFVLPLRLLFELVVLPIHPDVELYTLLAILVYGLLSRILVRFLKALLHSR